MAKFKLLDGSHVVSNEPLVVVSKGEIVESESDLVAKFGSNKFEHIADDKPVAPKAKAEKEAK